MIAAGGGRIINVSSRGAFRGEPDLPAYAASKAGLNAFSQSLARALGSYGIAVAAVARGSWPRTWRLQPGRAGGDEISGQSPFGRVAEPEEIAAAVLYLASARPNGPAGRYST